MVEYNLAKVEVAGSNPVFRSRKIVGRGMKVTVEELPRSRKQIQIELEEEEINKHFDKSLSQFAKSAQVRGFRKGKVPHSIIEMRLGKSLQTEVLKKILDESYEKVKKDEGVVPVSAPSIDTKGAMPEKNKPYSFGITVDVMPSVKIDDYKKLVLERRKFEITDKHVDAVLKQRQEESAEFLPVSDRPVMKGDWVQVDGDSLVNGKVIQDFSGRMVQVGSDVLPEEMNDALIGCSVGDEKDVNAETQSGEKITYRFKVKAIKERRLLIVDDEFAKDIGGFQSLDVLKYDIRKKLFAVRDIQIKEDLKRQVVDKLIDKAEAEFPLSFVEEQTKHIKMLSGVRMNDTAGKLSGKELEELAVRKLKEAFILDEIAEKENLTVTDDELEKVKAKISEERKDVKELNMDNVRRNLTHDKVMDFLLSAASIDDKEESLIVKPDEVSFVKK